MKYEWLTNGTLEQYEMMLQWPDNKGRLVIRQPKVVDEKFPLEKLQKNKLVGIYRRV